MFDILTWVICGVLVAFIGFIFWLVRHDIKEQQDYRRPYK